MLEILNWSLEHPWATLLWFLMVLAILQTICNTIIALARKPKERSDNETDT